MKGTQHPSNDVTINPSGNESIQDLIGRTDHGRRTFLKTAVSASILASLGGVSLSGLVHAVEAAPVPAGPGFPGIGFESIPASVIVPPAISIADEVRVPAGYKVKVLAACGDPIMPKAPDWLEDASQDASAQAMQFGMHVDGSLFFPYPQSGRGRGANPVRGLFCVNHEYTHEEILHGDQGLEYVPANAVKGIPVLGKPDSILTVPKIRKSQAAHGVTVMEVRKNAGKRQVARNSPFARRITANTPMRISGPAAGNDLLKVKEFRILPDRSEYTGRTTDGTVAWGTANNCAHGYTPWGTCLACEENWNGYFGWKDATTKTSPTKLENRYGVSRNGFVYGGASSSDPDDAIYSIYKWYQKDGRWDTAVDPNAANTFGWRVEIDPFDPDSTPVKRSALGRFKCESAQYVTDDNNGVAFYMGDDEHNEYIYKFVCARPYNPRNRKDNQDLLDLGTLYVAKFTSEGVPGKQGTYRGRGLRSRPTPSRWMASRCAKIPSSRPRPMPSRLR